MKFSRIIQHHFHDAIGDEGIRTPDPLLARQVLSQLSYTPLIQGNFYYVNRYAASRPPFLFEKLQPR